MRSFTVFLVFGAILVGVFLFTRISQVSKENTPVAKNAMTFLQAVKDQDVATVEQLTDSETIGITKAGNKLVSLKCKETIPIQGAFARRPEVIWSYVKLSQLTPDPTIDPIIDEEAGIGAFTMAGGSKIYLHKVESGEWKVFYIAEPDDKE